MSNIVILGLPNYSSQDWTTVTIPDPTKQPADMLAEWLKTEEPSDRARITTLDPRWTQWMFATSGVPQDYDGFALVNHNLESGSDVRFIGSSDPAEEAGLADKLKFQTATAFVSQSNITGTSTSIDDPISSPDGTYVTPTNPANPWSLLARWGPLTHTPRAGDRMLAFVLRLNRQYLPGATTATTAPRITVDLWENASLVKTLGSRAVTDEEGVGQILIWPFSLSDLADPTGAGIRCALTVTPGSGPDGGSYAQLESMALYYENSLDLFDYDSGWIELEFDDRSAPLLPSRKVHYFPESPWESITSYTVLIRSDQALHDPPFRNADSEVAEGLLKSVTNYVEAGVLCAGAAVTPERGIAHATGPAATRPEISALGGTTLSGQSYGSDAWKLIVTEPLDLLVTREELVILQQQLGLRRGRSGPVYVALEPSVNIRYQLMTSLWATLQNLSAPSSHSRYRADGSMLFKVSAEFREKL